MLELRGGTAVVTGAASGIGRGLAVRAAREGMRVLLADVDRDGLAGTEAAVREAGAEVAVQRCDVGDPDAVADLAAVAYDRFGSVRLLFNNAGVIANGRLWEMSTADWQWLLGVNLWGVINGINAFVPRMLNEGEPGCVVNTASLAGFLNAPFNGPYAASKHAVVAISETLHYELQAEQAALGAAVICAGPVATAIMDAGRNRPEGLAAGSASEAGEAFGEALRSHIESEGMDPAELAEQVFGAVRRGRFWILPHPAMMAPLRDKTERILGGDDPPRWEGM